VTTTRLQQWQDRLDTRVRASRFRRRWGFAPPPPWADSVGYEVLLEEIERHRLDRVDGDALEIGALLGGGTAKLCGWFERHAAGKRVIAIDVFDPDFDPTTTVQGWTMRELYAHRIGKRQQREVFDEVTHGCGNLLVVAGDSTSTEIPSDLLAFAFVDGSHVPDDVRSDFELVWDRLAPGGVAAFHDYGADLPGVTETLDACVERHAAEIDRVWTRSPAILFVRRR
jgi:SAM-dependent methyltransferase